MKAKVLDKQKDILDRQIGSIAKKFTVLGAVTPDEKHSLEYFPDMLQGVCFWIVEDVTKAHCSKLLEIHGPILSRFYQEISNGMLGFNHAEQINLLPYPFPLAQILAAWLAMLASLVPFISLAMAPGWLLAPGLTFFVVFA